MTKLPEMLSLWWLEENLYYDEAFVQEALAMVRRNEEQRPRFMRSTYSPATAISGLLSDFLKNRILTCYMRGKQVEDYQALEQKLVSPEGDIGRNIEAAKAAIHIKKAELVDVLRRCGLPLPQTLLDESTVVTPTRKNARPAISVSANEEPLIPSAVDTKNESWKMQVQAEATRQWRRWRQLNCSPSINDLASDLAKYCAEQNIRTKNGVIPSSEYIRKHALGRRYWTPPAD